MNMGLFLKKKIEFMVHKIKTLKFTYKFSCVPSSSKILEKKLFFQKKKISSTKFFVLSFDLSKKKVFTDEINYMSFVLKKKYHIQTH